MEDYSYELNTLMPDHDWLNIVTTAVLDQGFDYNQRLRFEAEVAAS
jgi:hypothetical protein